MPDKGTKQCSGCSAPLDAHNEGVELFGSWFCSTCFINHASKTHREMTPEDIAALKTLGRELSGYLPPEPLEMVLVGFYRRAGGHQTPPPPDELSRCVGEIQRLTAFCTMRKVLTLLKGWHETFTEFVEQQEEEIRQTVKRLTELE